MTSVQERTATTTGRSAPLDGVRALAVLAVLAYHAHYPWAVGGYLGVDVFFVLSGYLITGVLLSTHRSWWGYRTFLVRRSVRLVPALVVATAGVTAVALAIGLDDPVARCGAASLGYVMNLPFAESWGCHAMWHVTWSLAAEQQFYLVWPLVLGGLALVLRRMRTGPVGRGRGLAVAAALCLGAYGLSLVWQVVLRLDGASTARVAFAPDGRSLVLLVGCALALLTARRPPVWAGLRGRVADATAWAALGALVVCFAVAGIGPRVPDLVPIVVVGLASAALIAAVVRAPATSVVARVLGAAPVAWLGRVSYSLYLWHEVGYTLAELVAPRGSVVAEVLRFVLALGLAAASYYAVELPAQRWWRRRSERQEEEPTAPVLVSA